VWDLWFIFFPFIQNDLEMRKTTTIAMHIEKWHYTKYRNCLKNYNRKEQSEKSSFLKVERDSLLGRLVYHWGTLNVKVWECNFGLLMYLTNLQMCVEVEVQIQWLFYVIRWVQKRITEWSLFYGLWCSANLSQNVLLGS